MKRQKQRKEKSNRNKLETHQEMNQISNLKAIMTRETITFYEEHELGENVKVELRKLINIYSTF